MQEPQEMWAQSLGQEAPLEKGMAIHSSILAWRIPWTEDAGGLQSIALQRVGHDWINSTHAQTECREQASRDRRGFQKRKGMLQGQSLWVQEPIKFLILSEDESNFRWNLPPKMFTYFKILSRAQLPPFSFSRRKKRPKEQALLPSLWIMAVVSLNCVVSNFIPVSCPLWVSGWSGLWGNEGQKRVCYGHLTEREEGMDK